MPHWVRRELLYRALNGIFFYAGWFACIALAAKGLPWLGIGISCALLLPHFAVCTDWRRELFLMGITSLCGWLLDCLYMFLGVIDFASPNPWLPQLAPLWLIPLYALFASVLNSSLAYLRGHSLILAILAFLGGPLSYLAGARMGAATMTAGYEGLLVIGVAWALFMPFVDQINVYLGKKLSS